MDGYNIQEQADKASKLHKKNAPLVNKHQQYFDSAKYEMEKQKEKENENKGKEEPDKKE